MLQIVSYFPARQTHLQRHIKKSDKLRSFSFERTIKLFMPFGKKV